MKAHPQTNTGASCCFAGAHQGRGRPWNSIQYCALPPLKSHSGERVCNGVDASSGVKRQAGRLPTRHCRSRNQSNLSLRFHVRRAISCAAPTSAGCCSPSLFNARRASNFATIPLVKIPIRIGASTAPPLQPGLLNPPCLHDAPEPSVSASKAVRTGKGITAQFKVLSCVRSLAFQDSEEITNVSGNIFQEIGKSNQGVPHD